MSQTVSLGAQDFAYIRENDCFFVDKTDFIREWWENKDAVTLITRPRRFGKTLNLSMMECFFSVAYKNRNDLFEGLSIWKKEEYRKLQGTYPVIYMSFANIKGNTFQSPERGLYRVLSDCMENMHIFEMLNLCRSRIRNFLIPCVLKCQIRLLHWLSVHCLTT